MRGADVLQKCMDDMRGWMHARCRRVVLRVAETVGHGRRRTSMARPWLHADRIRARLKALNRWLDNPLSHTEREHIYTIMTRWRVLSKPEIIIDCSNLRVGRSW